MKYLYLKRNLSKKVYKDVLQLALSFCNEAIVVIHRYKPLSQLNSSIDSMIARLQPFSLGISMSKSWPGGGSLIQECEIFRFVYCQDTIKILSVEDDFFSWQHPRLPEDLCLFRPNGEPWLITIAHEKIVQVLVSEHEARELTALMPDIFDLSAPPPID
jgi:hypothetical protein